VQHEVNSNIGKFLFGTAGPLSHGNKYAVCAKAVCLAAIAANLAAGQFAVPVKLICAGNGTVSRLNCRLASSFPATRHYLELSAII